MIFTLISDSRPFAQLCAWSFRKKVMHKDLLINETKVCVRTTMTYIKSEKKYMKMGTKHKRNQPAQVPTFTCLNLQDVFLSSSSLYLSHEHTRSLRF